MSDCIHHLDHAFSIFNAERNPKQWPARIATLPEAAKKPVFLWLQHTQQRKRGPKRGRQHG